MKIENNIENFLELRKEDSRYTSFDYCYNYFHSFKKKKDISNPYNIEMSCLQLGMFLASWGMYRGSTKVLQDFNHKVYENVIKLISTCNHKIWKIDVKDYKNENTINLFKDFRIEIFKSFEEKFIPTETLVTKIMLGVYGNVPAFDTRFRKGLKIYGKLNSFSLSKIYDFYYNNRNRKIIDSYYRKLKTCSYKTGKHSNFPYSRAKIIDMIGFELGK